MRWRAGIVTDHTRTRRRAGTRRTGSSNARKHHSHYRPDGVFISGRATRSMDCFGIRRDGANVVVDVDKFYRQDQNPAEWESAFLAL